MWKAKFIAVDQAVENLSRWLKKEEEGRKNRLKHYSQFFFLRTVVLSWMEEKGVAKEAQAVSNVGVMLPDNKAVKKKVHGWKILN